jgi:hypothetical protein
VGSCLGRYNVFEVVAVVGSGSSLQFWGLFSVNGPKTAQPPDENPAAELFCQ